VNSPDQPRLTVRVVAVIVSLLAAFAVGIVVFSLVATAGLYGLIPDPAVNVVNFSLPGLMLLGSVWAAWKRVSLKVTLPVFGLASLFLLYLRWDDASPPPPATLPPVVSADSKSYQAYRWLLKDIPESRLRELPKSLPELPAFPAKREEWMAFVRQHRAQFDAAWNADLLGREWFDAMAANEPQGIFPHGGADTPMLNFATVKRTAVIHWAHAQILQQEGKSDEAAAVLLKVLQSSYHLQRAGTLLVTQMIASVLVKGTYERLELLVSEGTPTAAAKVRVAAVLRQAPPVPQNIALAFLGEDLFMRSALARMKGNYGEAIKTVASSDNSRFSANRVIGQFLFNPNLTEREHAAFLAETSRLAQERKLSSQVAETRFEALVNTKRLKNPVGHLFAVMSLPAFAKVSESFWSTEDLRRTLLPRFEN
jgi:hypothetical protein